MFDGRALPSQSLHAVDIHGEDLLHATDLHLAILLHGEVILVL